MTEPAPLEPVDPVRSDTGDRMRSVRWPRLLMVFLTISALTVAVSWATPHVMGVPLNAWDHSGRAWLDVGNENNPATWWNAMLLMIGGVSAAVVAGVDRNTRDSRNCGPVGQRAWLLVSAVLVALSLDEVASVHERLGRLAGAVLPEHGFSYAWLLLGVPLAALLVVLGAFVSREIGAVPRLIFLTGLVVLLAGAVGLELANELLVRFSEGSEQDVGATPLFHALYHLEELLEMLGASMLAIAPWSAVRIGADHQQLRVRVA